MAAIFTICISLLIANVACTCSPTYFIPKEKATRFQAMQSCKYHGADLVSVGNEDQANQLFSKLLEIGHRDTYYWISGLSYWKVAESKWWFDGTGVFMNYTEWCIANHQPEEPIGTGTYSEPCLALNYQGGDVCWHDYPCFTIMPYICEVVCKSKALIHFGEFCFNYDILSQERAHKSCKAKSLGKSLVSLDSPKKLKKIKLYFEIYTPRGSRFWSSFKRRANYSDEWIWNSASGGVADWVNWYGTRQRNPSNNCGIMERINKTFVTIAYPCNPYLMYYYICE